MRNSDGPDPSLPMKYDIGQTIKYQTWMTKMDVLVFPATSRGLVLSSHWCHP
jgi:hypothetical protein